MIGNNTKRTENCIPGWQLHKGSGEGKSTEEILDQGRSHLTAI